MEILKKQIAGTYEIDENGFVNVKGNVNLYIKGLSSFGDIKFGKVTGHFNCSSNKLTNFDLHCKVNGLIISDKGLNLKHPYSKEILKEILT